jgi:hypothetical protein
VEPSTTTTLNEFKVQTTKKGVYCMHLARLVKCFRSLSPGPILNIFTTMPSTEKVVPNIYRNITATVAEDNS